MSKYPEIVVKDEKSIANIVTKCDVEMQKNGIGKEIITKFFDDVQSVVGYSNRKLKIKEWVTIVEE